LVVSIKTAKNNNSKKWEKRNGKWERDWRTDVMHGLSPLSKQLFFNK
jgi:hypothetical protein